jgi:hypothetical protein
LSARTAFGIYQPLIVGADKKLHVVARKPNRNGVLELAVGYPALKTHSLSFDNILILLKIFQGSACERPWNLAYFGKQIVS